MSPKDFRTALAEHNLIALSSHQGINQMAEVDEMIAAVKAVGIQYFVIPVPPMEVFLRQCYQPNGHEVRCGNLGKNYS